MRKITKSIFSLAFSFLLATSVLAPTIKTNAASAPTDVTTEINGVIYEIYSGSNTCDAWLSDTGATKSEVTIPSKIDYKGNSYKVNFFHWDQEYENGIYSTTRQKMISSTSYQSVLKKITIDKGVRIVEPACHYKNLEQVIFNDPAAISNTTFYDCPKLKSLYIPKNAKGYPTVRECSSVKITAASDNPYYKVVNNDIYSKNGKILYSVSNGKSAYKVKSSVRKIASGAFYKNDRIKSITLTNKVKTIGQDAFSDMKNLKTVKLSKALKVLPSGLLKKSTKLSSLTIPANVKKIEGAFGGKSGCKLKKMYIQSSSLKKSSLGSIPKSCTIYVKNASVRKQVQKYGFKGKIIIKK